MAGAFDKLALQRRDRTLEYPPGNQVFRYGISCTLGNPVSRIASRDIPMDKRVLFYTAVLAMFLSYIPHSSKGADAGAQAPEATITQSDDCVLAPGYAGGRRRHLRDHGRAAKAGSSGTT